MEQRQVARHVDGEDRAVARQTSLIRCPEKSSVGSLDQPGKGCGSLGVDEGMDRRQVARRLHPEDDPKTPLSARLCRAVEVSVARLDQPGCGIQAIISAKGIE